jgi:hypothetical protein
MELKRALLKRALELLITNPMSHLQKSYDTLSIKTLYAPRAKLKTHAFGALGGGVSAL